jgi:exonuclease 1
MQELVAAKVQFIVAPYEADAQMAYLVRIGLADIVITEDSDLLAYGCNEILFKLDKAGACEHVRLLDLPQNRSLSFVGLDHHNFIEVRTPARA